MTRRHRGHELADELVAAVGAEHAAAVARLLRKARPEQRMYFGEWIMDVLEESPTEGVQPCGDVVP